MANRIKIRRGSGNPGGNLLSYELGWDTTNKALYINDGGTSKITALPLTGGTMSGNLTFSGTAGIQYQGTKNTYKMINFIDNTSDAYGNGISIGGGGQTIIGGGESASALVAQAGTSGSEIMWIGNDSDIDFYPTQQNGFDGSARIRMSASTLFAGVSGNTAREANVGVASGAGDIYMFSQAATSGARGIYLPAHGTGAAKFLIQVDTNNNITFYGSLSGNAATATKANGLADGSSTMTSAYNKAGLAYSDYSWLAGWNGYELRAVAKTQFAQASHSHSYLPLSGGTLTGNIRINNTTTNGSAYYMSFSDKDNADYAVMYASRVANYGGKINFREHSENSSGTRLSYYELYQFPTPKQGLTANATYGIVTSPSTARRIYVASAGTTTPPSGAVNGDIVLVKA